MSSGATHDKITLILTPISYAVMAHYVPSLAPFTALGCAANLWLSPDLDTVSKPFKRWGILRLIWLPYLKLVKHRSLISHSPVLSTLIRVAYLGVPAIAVGHLAGVNLVQWLQPWRSELLAALVGLMVADMGHLVADGILLGKRRRAKQNR